MSLNDLIVNSSFETNDLTGWNAVNTTVVYGQAHSGFHSARLASGAAEASLSQTVAATAGERYELLVSLAKTTTNPSPVINIQVLFLNAANTVVGTGLDTEIFYGNIPFAENGTWHNFYQNTEPAPAGTTQAQVIISKPVSAITAPAVLVDDVELLSAEGGDGVGPTGPIGPTGPTGPT
ncbi:NTTRR-F1 domain, partial [Sediminibacillus halophilus]